MIGFGFFVIAFAPSQGLPDAPTGKQALSEITVRSRRLGPQGMPPQVLTDEGEQYPLTCYLAVAERRRAASAGPDRAALSIKAREKPVNFDDPGMASTRSSGRHQSKLLSGIK